MSRESPWLRDLLALPVPPLLDRAAFVARYLPRYVDDWQPDHRIRLRPDGRVTRTTPGNAKAQRTKRSNRIDEAYARYCSDHAASVSLSQPRD